ncbi:transglycosylase SLT domain-containing protein [Candidatus Uhrbacteria bacterium]|nr:transglycosylase SLT domain-containing protein [Candidatus Uhrbacteria bacterium]
MTKTLKKTAVIALATAAIVWLAALSPTPPALAQSGDKNFLERAVDAVTPGDVKPRLTVDIPTVKFSDVIVHDDRIDIPWLAEYISGLYKYALGIGSLLAAVMMVIGGFIYLTAGDSRRTGQAKEMITDSILGLSVLIGSYVLLNAVNPDLTRLDALQIVNVNPEKFIVENPGGMDEGTDPDPNVDYSGKPVPTKGTAPSGSDIYDDIFKRYAGCAGVDWRVLKAVAKKESAFRSDLVNKFGFIGLFQTKPSFCSLKRYGRAEDCTYEKLADPEINTASAAGGQLKNATNTIRTKCPNIKDTDTFVMLMYFGHNSGNGALKSVLDDVGCNGTREDYYEGGKNFWMKQAERKGTEPIHNYDKRMQYASKVADAAKSYGVTEPIVPGPCPL